MSMPRLGSDVNRRHQLVAGFWREFNYSISAFGRLIRDDSLQKRIERISRD